MNADALYEELKEFENDSERLDDMVHDAASKIGSGVNNGGVHEQITFLLEHGYAEHEIRCALKDEDPA